MNRRQPLILMNDPATVSSGLLPDKHVLFAPLWDVAVNVRFYQGKVRRLVPPAVMFTATHGQLSRGLHQQQMSTGERYVMQAVHYNNAPAPQKIQVYRWLGIAPALMAEFEGIVQDQVFSLLAPYIDFTTWGDWTILNSGVGPALLFKDVGDANALPNAPEDVVQFFKKQNQLLAVGHGPNKKLVSWSDADQIDVWDPDDPDNLGNLSGTLPIEELDTGIKAAARLGQNIACYAEDQMAIVYWVGLPAIYGQRVQLDGIGAVGKRAVCADGQMNYGVSRNGIWRTDGTQFAYIDQGALSDYLQENVNWDQASKIQAFRNDVTRQIEFHFPMGANLEPSEGWAFDTTSGGWSRVVAYQSADERVMFDKPIAAKNGVAYLLDDNLNSAAALDLVTKPMLIQADQQALHLGAKIDEIEVAAKTAIGIQFRYSVAEDIQGEWFDGEWINLDTTMHTYQLGPEMPTGTFHKLAFRSIITAWELDLQGFALFGDADGRKRTRL